LWRTKQKPIVANERGLNLDDRGYREHMFVAKTRCCENLLNIFRHELPNLLFDGILA
jgi:hypothetical protein